MEEDVISAVKSFFNTGKLLGEVNSTNINLVPKVPNPSKMGEFRPIFYCNLIYKCITNILANKLRPRDLMMQEQNQNYFKIYIFRFNFFIYLIGNWIVVDSYLDSY